MNQIKPYLFWIVAAAVLVLILVGSWIFAPRGTWNGNTVNAVEAKEALDAQSAKFKDLVRRVDNGDPLLPVDPVIPGEVDKLINDHLLTEKWEPVINDTVSAYGKQLQALRENLVARSTVLHEKIADSTDQLRWYRTYREKTGEFVTMLRDAGCLVLPKSAATTAARTTPMGGATPASSGEDDPLDPSSGATIRGIVGLFTQNRSGELPPVDLHPQLTTRFRVVEAVGRVVLASAVATRENPVIAFKGTSSAPAAIASLEWSNDNKPLEGDTGKFATYIRLTLQLQGSESALLAALAGLESLDKPIGIVVSSTLSRQERLPSGERLTGDGDGFRAASANLTVDLMILDYSQMPDPTAENLQTLQPAGGPSGLPGMGGGLPPMPDFNQPSESMMPPDLPMPPQGEEDL